MRVALINPRNIDTPNHPLGLLYIAAALEKEGHIIKIFDQEMDITPAKFAKEIMMWMPEIVGLTSTTPQFELGLKIASEIKLLSNTIPVVFGGAHPSVCPAEVIANDSVDFVVIGEGENIMANLCRCVQNGGDLNNVKSIGYKKSGQLIFTQREPLIENLDTIPFPARHLLSSYWYFAPPRIRGVWTKSLITVMASRGCPYRCIWCSSHTIFGRKVRFRSPANIMEEILQARKDFNIDSVYFVDDTFTVNIQWVETICELFKKRELKGIKWACQARVNTVTAAILKKMKAAGCVQLDFGVESGSQRVLNILKKDITIEQTKLAFRRTKEAGIKAFASVIVGTPGETKEDVMMTYQLLKELKPDYTEIFYATPYPGTRLYEIANELKVFNNNPIVYDNWYVSKQIDNPVMSVGFSKNELIKLRSMLENQVIWRNYLTLFGDLTSILRVFQILNLGFLGLFNGFKRFISTGKIDSISVEVLRYYRKKTKSLFYK